MKKFSFILYIFLNQLYAVTAYQGQITLSQPNGEIFSAFIKGDEWQHWHETPNGYTISQNIQNLYNIDNAKLFFSFLRFCFVFCHCFCVTCI